MGCAPPTSHVQVGYQGLMTPGMAHPLKYTLTPNACQSIECRAATDSIRSKYGYCPRKPYGRLIFCAYYRSHYFLGLVPFHTLPRCYTQFSRLRISPFALPTNPWNSYRLSLPTDISCPWTILKPTSLVTPSVYIIHPLTSSNFPATPFSFIWAY